MEQPLAAKPGNARGAGTFERSTHQIAREWVAYANRAEPEAELTALCTSVRRGQPFWRPAMASLDGPSTRPGSHVPTPRSTTGAQRAQMTPDLFISLFNSLDPPQLCTVVYSVPWTNQWLAQQARTTSRPALPTVVHDAADALPRSRSGVLPQKRALKAVEGIFP